MTEQPTTSHIERVLQWLPAPLRSWAETSAFLPPALNDILTDRDTRMTGSPGSGKILTALIAVVQKLVDRKESARHCAVILSSSREAEESTLAQAKELAAAAGLRAVGTAGVRDSAGLTKLFADPVDLLVTSAKTLEKLFDRGLLAADTVRTVVVDEAEWQDAQGDMPHIISLCETLPAARQVIAVTLPGNTLDEALTELLHAPCACRAPDREPVKGGVERAVLVPEEELESFLMAEAAKAPVLFIAGTPAAGTRLVAAMKAAGLDPKRATPVQTESARETLLLKFAAGRVDQLVMPHALLKGFDRGTLRRIVHPEMPGSPSTYLEHLSLLTAETGELVTAVTPETLPLFEKLLCCIEKKLTLENPYALPDVRAEIGLVTRREKLTIRADYGKEAPAEEADAPAEAAPAEDDDREPRRRPQKKFDKFEKRKNRDRNAKNGKRRFEDRSDAPQTDADGEERPQGKRRFQNKKRPSVKNGDKSFNKAPKNEASADVKPEGTAPATDVASQPKPAFKKKPFKDRRPKAASSAELSERPVRSEPTERADEARPAPKKRFERKPKKTFDRPKAERRENRRDEWDDDNFGNSIHYQPKRQNLRTLRSDQPIHWEPNDPFHPSAQSLSLPQLMPDEFQPRRNRRDVNGNSNGNGGSRRKFSPKGNFRRKRGPNEN